MPGGYQIEQCERKKKKKSCLDERTFERVYDAVQTTSNGLKCLSSDV